MSMSISYSVHRRCICEPQQNDTAALLQHFRFMTMVNDILGSQLAGESDLVGKSFRRTESNE